MSEETAASMVRDMRLRRRMTKSVFARLVDMPLSTVSRIESGKMEPTWAMM